MKTDFTPEDMKWLLWAFKNMSETPYCGIQVDPIAAKSIYEKLKKLQ